MSSSRWCCPLTRCRNPGGRRVRCFELFPVVLSIAVVWSCGAIATAAGAYNNASPDTQKYCRTDQVPSPGDSSAVNANANRNLGIKYIHKKEACRSDQAAWFCKPSAFGVMCMRFLLSGPGASFSCTCKHLKLCD